MTKVNTIRNELNQTKSYILLMQAKLNNLKLTKQKLEHKTSQTNLKI